MRRAAHQLFDRPLVLVDPLACHILGPQLQHRIVADRAVHEESGSRHLRALLVARSRYAEDALAATNGVRQYVVLGAGLDTSALRGADPTLRIFEVDHPATQAAKQMFIERAQIVIPPNVVFIAVDFETESLEAGLARSGFDAAAPAFFSWLGVTPYLTRDAILTTLRFVGALRSGTEIVFDFAVPSSAASPMAAKVGSIAEPWCTFFEPDELIAVARSLGFSRANVVNHEALNRLYFDGRDDGLRLRTTGQLMHARVGS